MTSDTAEPEEDDFTLWAVHCHEAIFTDRRVTTEPDSSLESSAPSRMERFKACLLRLEDDRQTRLRSSSGTYPNRGPRLAPVVELPKELGRFRILQVLGTGGFGVVYLAEDPRLGRLVALKVPRPEALLSSELMQRFVREAHTAARLSHPHILPVFESGEAGPFCYLVSAYCAGGSLAGWLSRQKQLLPPRTVAELTAALAGAIQHAHECKVLHRDLKPANVLLESPEGPTAEPWSSLGFVPRVGDFGLAKFLDPDTERVPNDREPAAASAPLSSLTRTQHFFGTPADMAPEQAESRRAAIGPATDVYALGVILYELLVGHPPFQGENSLDTLRQVAEQEPAPPRAARPEVPADLEAICLKCLEKRPERRYVSAAALAKDLQQFLTGRPTNARPVGVRGRALKWCLRKPALAGLVVTVVLACLVVTGSVFLQFTQRRAHITTVADLTDQERQRAAEVAERELSARLAQEQALKERYGRRISVIAGLWHQGDRQTLRPRLDELRPARGQPDLRGFEWWFLWARGTCRLFEKQKSPVKGLAFTADGRRVLSTTFGQSVVHWETATGKVERSVESDSKAGLFGGGPAFTQDGGRLAIIADTEVAGVREVEVWDTASGRRIAQRKSAISDRHSLVLSPDGQLALYCTRPPAKTEGSVEIRVWRIDQNTEKVLRPASIMGVTCMAISRDGQTLALAAHPVPFALGQHGFFVEIWDLNTGCLRHTLLEHRHLIYALAFSPDGRFLASGSADLSACLWNVETGAKIRPFSIGAIVGNLEFSPDGRRLAVSAVPPPSSYEKTRLSLWDIGRAEELTTALEPGCAIETIAFSPDGKCIGVGCADGALRLWEPSEKRSFVDLPGPKGGEAWAVTFSPDGRTLAVGYDDETGGNRLTLALWDRASQRIRKVLVGHDAVVFDVAFTPDGKTLASSCFNKTVRLWDAETGSLRHTLTGHRDRVRSVAFLPDGDRLVSGARDGKIHIWDAATGEKRTEIDAPGNIVHSLAVSPDGKALIAAVGSSVCLWELPAGTLRQTFEQSSYVAAVAFNHDGSQLAAGSETGEIRIWNFRTGDLAALLRGHPRGKRGAVLGLAFSPDDKTLASAGEDKTLRLWQVATGAELLSFKDLPAAANDVSFSPDGTWLAAALHDGAVRLWNAPFIQ